MTCSPTLAELQRALADQITSEPNDAAEPSGLTSLRGQAPLLAIYRHAWRARLTEALRSNYSVLHQVLGDADFGSLAEQFMREQPSSTASIRWFGAALPGWLAVHPEHLAHPALLDLARMEWALGLSFDSADADSLRFEDLVQLDAAAWPELRVSPHPSVQVLELSWAIEPLWQLFSQRADADPEPESDPPEASAHHLLVWRQGLETRWRSLESDEGLLLDAALAGQSFAALCELAQSLQPDQGPALAASTLRGWVDSGLLIAPDC
jgi:hypothetical protein